MSSPGEVIEWGESAYPEERYICTQVLFAQLFPGSSKSLTSMCDIGDHLLRPVEASQERAGDVADFVGNHDAVGLFDARRALRELALSYARTILYYF